MCILSAVVVSLNCSVKRPRKRSGAIEQHQGYTLVRCAAFERAGVSGAGGRDPILSGSDHTAAALHLTMHKQTQDEKRIVFTAVDPHGVIERPFIKQMGRLTRRL